MKIIAVLGYAGSGKDTFAEFLKDELEIEKDSTAKILHFADPIKKLAYDMGWDGKKDKKGRRFLQHLGTEIGRSYNKNYWIDKLKETILQQDVDYIILPDTRFKNEVIELIKLQDNFNFIKNFNDVSTELVVMTRPVKGLSNKIKAFFLRRHSSEKYKKWIKDFSYYIIDNNGSKDALKEKVRDIANML